MNKTEALKLIKKELTADKKKGKLTGRKQWPDDCIHAASIIFTRAGKLSRDCLGYEFYRKDLEEGYRWHDINKMKYQSAKITCGVIRFLENNMETGHNATNLILREFDNAIEKHPDWRPEDKIHQAAILAEKSGGLLQYALDYEFCHGNNFATIKAPKLTYKNCMKTEAAQCGAIAIRFLMNL